MAAQIAIDYGTDRLRLLEFDGSGRKIRVLAVEEVDLAVAPSEKDDVEPDDLRAEALAEAVKEARLVTDPSGMAFDAAQAVFREFDLPFTADEQIQKVVRFEAESHIPMDIDDVVVQHVVLRKTRDKSHILAAAVRKDDLLDRFDVLEEAGLDPMFVDMDVFALHAALVGTGVAEESGNLVVVNAQASSTSLLFLVDGGLYAVRSLRLGAHGLPAASEQGEASSLDRDIDTARAHDYEGRLKREIRRTLATLPSLGPVGKLYVTGSGSRIEGFCETVAEIFGVPAEPLDLLARVDHKLEEDEARRFGPDIGVALGLAFKLNGLDPLGADFRQEECAYTHKFDQVKSPLIVLSFLAFLVVALLCIDAFYQVKRMRQEYRYLLTNAEDQLEVLLEDVEEAEKVYASLDIGPQRMDAIKRRVDQEYERLAGQLGRSSLIPPQPSALAAWIELSKIIKENEPRLGRLWLQKLDISVTGRQPSIKISGVVENAGKYDLLLEVLRQDRLYLGVSKQGTLNTTDEGLTTFTETTIDLDVDVLRTRMES